MTDDPVAIWREAIKDDQHPRHRAAWLLFTGGMRPSGAAKLLAATKDDVISWLYEILDIETLYDEGSLGDGDAPINACRLLGEWKVVEAAPRLWQIVEIEDWESRVHHAALSSLIGLGSEILEFALELAKDPQSETLPELMAILSESGRGDARAFELICKFFERQRTDEEVELAAELVLRCKPEMGADYIDQQIHKSKYRGVREELLEMIEQARNGDYDY